MAATGFTPVYIYSSNTGGNAPSAANLTNTVLGSELAINITDGYLYYKDNANAIQKIGYKLVPIASGGTNSTSFTAKSGNVAGIVFFDGTKLTNDATVTDVGYDTITNTFVANRISIGNTTDPGAGNLSVNGQIYSNSGYGSVAAEYGCRAWVNMDCTGTPSIRGSGNVTSVSSLGTGYFGVTLTNAMPDRNYCAVVSAGYHQGATTTSYTTLDQYGNNTTSIIKFYAQDVGGSGYAPDWACLSVFR